MSFEAFLQRLGQLGISPVLDGENIILRGLGGTIAPELKELTSKYQERLRVVLRRDAAIGSESILAIQSSSGSTQGSPLSFYQERLWVHYERDPQDLSYNIPVMFLVHGDLDVTALEESLNTIMARHESLRTYFGKTKDGTILQFIAPHERLKLPAIQASGAELVEHVRRHLEHRFDLFHGPIFKASLLSLAEHKHLLLLNVHHIATDAWSIQGIFLLELQHSYAAFVSGSQPNLTPLTVQYKDFAQWQRTRDVAKEIEFWTQTLRDYEDTLDIPSDRLRHPKSGRSSSTFVLKYPAKFSHLLDRFSRDHGCTVFMSLLASLGLTLSRYASKTDLCIGTTTSGRSQVEVESLIGFFINILPLRLSIDEDVTVRSYLKETRELTLRAFEHQGLPFERILQVTGHAGSGNANPLVPVIVRHQNFPQTSLRAPLPGGVRFGPYPDPDAVVDDAAKLLASTEKIAARCEIELSYVGSGSELEVEVVYASDLYERSTIDRLLGYHQRLLEEMIANADR